MNDPKRIDELEKQFKTFEDDTNHSLTMLLGQAWKQGEQLKLIKERIGRVDDRVTEAHKELAEVHLHMATKEDIAALRAAQERQDQLLREILNRLPPK